MIYGLIHYKRVNWFRHPDETDEQFVERLGVTVSDLNEWKRDEGIDNLPMSVFRRMAKVLDVYSLWLAWGASYKVFPCPDGGRLTTFERFRPWLKLQTSRQSFSDI